MKIFQEVQETSLSVHAAYYVENNVIPGSLIEILRDISTEMTTRATKRHPKHATMIHYY